MERSARTYLIASFVPVLAVFFLAGNVFSAEYEITATIDNPGDGTGQITGAPSADPILQFSSWKGRSCSGVDKIDRCIIRGLRKNDTQEVTVTFAAPCTAFYYTQFGECDASGRMYRSVTSAIPSGCTGGNPVLVGSCTFVRIDPIITRVVDAVVDFVFPPEPPPPPPEVEISIITSVNTTSENFYTTEIIDGGHIETITEKVTVPCTGCVTIIQKVYGNESFGVVKSADTAGTGGETTKDSSGNVVGQIPQPESFSYYSEDTNETTIVSFVKDLANSVGSYFGLVSPKPAPIPTPAPIPSPTAKTAPNFDPSKYKEVEVICGGCVGTKVVEKKFQVFVPEKIEVAKFGVKTTKTTTRDFYKNGVKFDSEVTTEISIDGEVTEINIVRESEKNEQPKPDLSEPPKSAETNTGGFFERAGDIIGNIVGAIGDALGAIGDAIAWAADKLMDGLRTIGGWFGFGGGDSSASTPSTPSASSGFSSDPTGPNKSSSSDTSFLNTILNGGGGGGCGQDFGDETAQNFLGKLC